MKYLGKAVAYNFIGRYDSKYKDKNALKWIKDVCHVVSLIDFDSHASISRSIYESLNTFIWSIIGYPLGRNLLEDTIDL